MGISGAVLWWEDWQLRTLVLCSLLIQYFLLAASVARKFPIRSYFRPFIWLAYLGSDAVAIYALAILFNRHRKPQQEDGESGGSRLLEVLWAPVLLMHLGGQDGITAYNIEDNELWTRHILTSVSQVIVAVYVFWKSWSGNDMRLLQAAILLFIVGTLRCFEKPLALNRASINSLVSSSEPVWRSINTQKLKIDPLEDFIDKATNPVEENRYLLAPAMPVDFTPHKLFVDLASPSANDRIRMLLSFSALDDKHAYCTLQNWISGTFQLLYTKTNWFLTASGLAGTNKRDREGKSVGFYVVGAIRVFAVFLPFTAVALFEHSHREIYCEEDVKVTYVLLCCTAVLEICAFGTRLKITYTEAPSEPWEDNTSDIETPEPWDNISDIETPEPTELKPKYEDMVSQHSLIGLLIRNRKHSKMMSIVGLLRCNNFLYQHWHMYSCPSSFSITKLVLQYVKGGWKHHIKDVPSYRKFNDNRGQFTIQQQGCHQELGWSLEGAFDESVLLWHLATDFCYYDSLPSHHGSWCTKDLCHVYACPAWCEGSDHHKRAVQCREMSNYMMYLLFVNPEMLMAGTRRNLFTVAYDELKGINIQQPVEERDLTAVMRRELIRNKERSITGKEDEQPQKELELTQKGMEIKRDKVMERESTYVVQRECIREKIRGIISELDGDKQAQKERELTQRIIVALDGGRSPPADGTLQKKGIIHDAWTIAKVLSGLPEEKMWTVIEGVWVEMICFSAGRCRGYLHAKGLATGVEYLTYVWLLQYYMGMETLADKLQRADHRHHAPSTSGVSKEATEQEQAASPSRSSGSASQSAGYQGSDATATGGEIGEEMV